jgi:hypothetical protein
MLKVTDLFEWATEVQNLCWGDALTKESRSNVAITSSSVEKPSPNVWKKKADERRKTNNLKTNKWKNEEAVSKLRDSLIEENALIGPIVAVTVEEPKLTLDYNHPAVIKYINADRLCSDLWKRSIAAREDEKKLISTDDKTVLIQRVINTFNEWLIASEDRFVTIKEIKRIGDFDFQRCFETFFPEEKQPDHCANMESTYTMVKKYRLRDLKKKLVKLSEK